MRLYLLDCKKSIAVSKFYKYNCTFSVLHIRLFVILLSTFGFKSDNNAFMWNKIYLIILAAAVLISGVLMYFPFSWLQSIGAPATVLENYDHYSNIGSIFLWISTIILLLAANVVLWKYRKSWALWASLLYFAAFTVLQTFWLERMFFQYKQDNISSSSGILWSPFLGVLLIVLMAVIVFFNQYLVKRLHDKMYLSEQPAPELPAEIPADESKI